MNAVTYGGTRAARGTVSRRTTAEKPRPFLERFLDALRESRREQARRVIKDHPHLFSDDPDSPV